MFFRKSIALVSLSLAAICHAKAAMKQVESVSLTALAAQGWAIASELPAEQEISLEIGLTYQNQDQLIRTLLDVSNPRSKNYGRWLKKKQVEDIVKPSQEANDAVVKWLASEGITKIATDGTWIRFKTNIKTANRVLSADFKRYQRDGVNKVRTTSYSVPEDVLEHVDIIHPTTFFGKTEAENAIHFPQRLVKREEKAPPPEQPASAPPAAAFPVSVAPPPVYSQPQVAPAPVQPPVPRVPVIGPGMNEFAPPNLSPPPNPIVPPKGIPPTKQVPAFNVPANQAPPPKPSNYPKSSQPKSPRFPKPASPKGVLPVRPKPYFNVDRSCEDGISPDCVRQMYNIGNYTPLATSGSKVAFSSFLNQSAQFADLLVFEKAFGIANQTFEKVFITPDAMNSQNPAEALKLAGEANLDVQNIIAIAHGLPVVEFLHSGKPPFIPDLEMKTDADNTNEPYVPYYQYLLAQNDTQLPQVISNSYGEPEHTVPFQYASRTCTMAAQLTLRGVTILESSGDTGIGSYCMSNDGQKRPQFLPEFPSTCPWITSVGGTEAVSPEIAWRDSSGGFSYYFERPSFQADAVETFFSDYYPERLKNAWRTYFNPAGRAFPDISAHSLYPEYKIVYGREMSGGGGTSAASPIWGAIVGLLNDARLRANLPVLGFINPWLYTYADDVLVDIQYGRTRGCNGRNEQTGKIVPGAVIIPGAGWNATVGWDPATGLGIPDFEKMLLKAVLDVEEDDS